MSFYYPLGLLGLIGIPIILLIYIIKSKYTEQTIATTYLWELSEKFLKKRKPVSKLTGIITLVLQLLAVLFVSFAVAHPVFTVSGSATDIYFVLDSSASMNMRRGEQTRFDIAKQRINEIIDGASSGSTYTLALAGDDVHTVFEGVSDKEQAKIFVDNLSEGWSGADFSAAAAGAQAYFDANRSAVMYLVTDRHYETSDALELIDVSNGESNFAFVDYGHDSDERGVRGVGRVISYATDAQITVEMYIAENIGDEPVKVGEVTVDATAGEPCEFVIASDRAKFAELRLVIANGDAFREDNTVVIYDAETVQERKVLIVSNIDKEGDDAVYLRNAIRYAGKAEVDVVSAETYENRGAVGYDMYVFNGYAPSELPKRSTVWLIDAVDGSYTGSGISYRGHVTPRDAQGPNSYYKLEYTDGTSAVEQLLTRDIVGRSLAVRTYAQYVAPRNFTRVLGVGGDGMVLAGLNDNNDRQVVFSFRIKDSDLGLTDDFLILVRNLMDYSFPAVLTQTLYVCGDTMAVNVVSGCEGIVVTSPSGKSNTLDTLDADVCEFDLDETGAYTLTVKLDGRDEQKLYAYAAVPEAESRGGEGGEMLIAGEREYNYADGFYDSLLIFFIVIAVLLIADWGVYCYEQYQLR